MLDPENFQKKASFSANSVLNEVFSARNGNEMDFDEKSSILWSFDIVPVVFRKDPWPKPRIHKR